MTWLPPGPALLFCPADRPERYAKAAARADVVILDLEDAVGPENRTAARHHLADTPLDPERTIVRVNPVNSPDHADDLAALARTDYRVVMLAKTESAAHVDAVAHGVPGRTVEVLALVETPLGVVRVADIAGAAGCGGLMWGAEDLVAGLGGTSSRNTSADAANDRGAGTYRDVPRYARSAVAVAAGAFGRYAVDSVHLDIADHDGQRAEALDALALGFAGTACIHPAQVAVIRDAYRPSDDELAWARAVMAAAEHHPGVFRLDGHMVDGPVLSQAAATLRRAG